MGASQPDSIEDSEGGLMRLTSRTKVKKEEGVKKKTHAKKDKALEWTNMHISLVKDIWEMRFAQYIHLS